MWELNSQGHKDPSALLDLATCNLAQANGNINKFIQHYSLGKCHPDKTGLFTWEELSLKLKLGSQVFIFLCRTTQRSHLSNSGFPGSFSLSVRFDWLLYIVAWSCLTISVEYLGIARIWVRTKIDVLENKSCRLSSSLWKSFLLSFSLSRIPSSSADCLELAARRKEPLFSVFPLWRRRNTGRHWEAWRRRRGEQTEAENLPSW